MLCNLKGPFLCFDIVDSEASAPHEWSSIKISNDGDHILISTRSEVLYIVDAYEGHLKHRLKGHMNRTGLSLDANFTPCGNYVYSGSQDGSVYVWSVKSGDSIATLEGHGEPCTAVAWNPRYMMFASADSNLVWWTTRAKVLRRHSEAVEKQDRSEVIFL